MTTSQTERETAARKLERASGALATAATTRMDELFPWFRRLPADERAWVSLVAQVGISAFVEWFGHPNPRPDVTVDVFDTAPRDLARAISLEQTVAMVRCTVDLIEEQLPSLAGAQAADEVQHAALVYAREVAFAAAEVYARAAEARGAWDARLEALVLEGLLRGEIDPALSGRAAALGWLPTAGALVMVGHPPAGVDVEHTLDLIRRSAHHHGVDALTGLHGDVLVALLGRRGDDTRSARLFTPHFGEGPVVVSTAANALADVSQRAREALIGLRAAAGWQHAPRPVDARELLPERGLLGERAAQIALVEQIHAPLAQADAALISTLATYLEQAGSMEETARLLFVHPNTVRHRLRRIEQITGRSPHDPRDGLALRLALIWARLEPSL
ncbi:MAG: helix-turn-helix domain-containing protein [Candidatus Nanopelagicales bacterium]